jgi:hypothetical protein
MSGDELTRPGRYVYTDPGGDPITLLVLDDGGTLVARFPAADGDEGADVPVADMAGDFAPCWSNG